MAVFVPTSSLATAAATTSSAAPSLSLLATENRERGMKCKVQGSLDSPLISFVAPVGGDATTCWLACQKDAQCLSYSFDTGSQQCITYNDEIQAQDFTKGTTGQYFWERSCLYEVCSAATSTSISTSTVTLPASTVTRLISSLSPGPPTQSIPTITVTMSAKTVTSTVLASGGQCSSSLNNKSLSPSVASSNRVLATSIPSSATIRVPTSAKPPSTSASSPSSRVLSSNIPSLFRAPSTAVVTSASPSRSASTGSGAIPLSRALLTGIPSSATVSVQSEFSSSRAISKIIASSAIASVQSTFSSSRAVSKGIASSAGASSQASLPSSHGAANGVPTSATAQRPSSSNPVVSDVAPTSSTTSVRPYYSSSRASPTIIPSSSAGSVMLSFTSSRAFPTSSNTPTASSTAASSSSVRTTSSVPTTTTRPTSTLVTTTSAVTSCDNRPSVVPNGDFESGGFNTVNWGDAVYGGNSTIVQGTPSQPCLGGNYCLHMTARDPGDQRGGWADDDVDGVPTCPGTTYTFSAWVRPGNADNAQKCAARADVNLDNTSSGFQTMGSEITSWKDTSSWVQITGTFTATTARTNIYINGRCPGLPTLVNFYWDDVTFTPQGASSVTSSSSIIPQTTSSVTLTTSTAQPQPTCDSRPAVVSNGDFELGKLSNWGDIDYGATPAVEASSSSQQCHSGNYCLHQTAGDPKNTKNGGWYSDTVTRVQTCPGTQYSVSAFVRPGNAANQKCTVNLQVNLDNTSAGFKTVGSPSAFNDATTWMPITGSFTATQSQTTIYLHSNCQDRVTPLNMYWDDIQFSPMLAVAS